MPRGGWGRGISRGESRYRERQQERLERQQRERDPRYETRVEEPRQAAQIQEAPIFDPQRQAEAEEDAAFVATLPRGAIVATWPHSPNTQRIAGRGIGYLMNVDNGWSYVFEDGHEPSRLFIDPYCFRVMPKDQLDRLVDRYLEYCGGDCGIEGFDEVGPTQDPGPRNMQDTSHVEELMQRRARALREYNMAVQHGGSAYWAAALRNIDAELEQLRRTGSGRQHHESEREFLQRRIQEIQDERLTGRNIDEIHRLSAEYREYLSRLQRLDAESVGVWREPIERYEADRRFVSDFWSNAFPDRGTSNADVAHAADDAADWVRNAGS